MHNSFCCFFGFPRIAAIFFQPMNQYVESFALSFVSQCFFPVFVFAFPNLFLAIFKSFFLNLQLNY